MKLLCLSIIVFAVHAQGGDIFLVGVGTFEEVETECQHYGAEMLSIHNEETHQIAFDLCQEATREFNRICLGGRIRSQQCFIGLRTDNGEFAWTDGSDFDYAAWDVDEPDMRDDTDDVFMYDEGPYWHDIPHGCEMYGLCKLQAGTTSIAGPANPICGNAIAERPEECDDGDSNDFDECRSDCTVPVCGDGILDTHIGEECDDGNTEGGDGCRWDCVVECGDGLLGSMEVCDTALLPQNTECQGYCESCSLEYSCFKDIGDCYYTHGSGCSDGEVSQCVCDKDSYCCNTEWDDTCVNLATSECSENKRCTCTPINTSFPSQCIGFSTKKLRAGICGCGTLETDTNRDGVIDCLEPDCRSNPGATQESCSTPCGNCDDARDTPGCSENKISSCVCGYDLFCCSGLWDELCVDYASSECQCEK